MHRPAGAFRRFANGLGYSTTFANADSDIAAIITNDDHHAERKAASAFDHFRHTRNVNNALVQLFTRLFISFSSLRSFRHVSLLELQTGFATGIGQSFNLAMVAVTTAIKYNCTDTCLLGAL